MNNTTDENGGSRSVERMVRRCVTHHFACDCREALMAEAMETQRRVVEWQTLSDEGLRLRMGELSAQEIRAVRAVLRALCSPNAEVTHPEPESKP